MKLFKVIIGAVVLNCFVGPSIAKDFDDAEIKYIGYPEWFIESPFLDLADDISKARLKGKQGLMVLFTTEGCSYCDEFIRKNLDDPEIASLVQKSFDSVGMEIFDDTEMVNPYGKAVSVKQFVKQEGVQFSPTLLFYGGDGKRILRQVGYQSPERFKNILRYPANDHYRSESLHSFLKRQAAEAPVTQYRANLINNPIFEKPPYALDRSHFQASKPLLVIFEKTNCIECGHFHAGVLALKEISETLRQFEIVRLDEDDMETPV